MSATVIVIVKLMPESPSVNLNEIENRAKQAMEKEGAKNVTFEQQSLAFGLKAILLKCAFPEEKGTDLIEKILLKVPHVSSVSLEDYRRAFG